MKKDPRQIREKPKDWARLTYKEGRPKTVNGTRARNVKMSEQLWNQNYLWNFFRTHDIRPNGNWNVSFKNPGRNMTAADQVILGLADSETEYSVQLNLNSKILIIEELEP